jgi:malate/lactate dehydrogenase
MERKDLLTQNKKIFEEQGKALNQYAKKSLSDERECVSTNRD